MEARDDYRIPFDPKFRLENLSRAALARLGRKYMLYGHIRDRGLMPALAMRFGGGAVDAVAIDEWMGASPVYTKRMHRAMAIEGDDVVALMKSLQLDVGFRGHWLSPIRGIVRRAFSQIATSNTCTPFISVEKRRGLTQNQLAATTSANPV